jgi:hypothetical protein
MQLERVYHSTAEKALGFCKSLERTREFRSLCETLSNHLGNIMKVGLCVCVCVCVLIAWLLGWLGGWFLGWLVCWLVGGPFFRQYAHSRRGGRG